MITVIHGSDITKSRNFYIETRQKIENPDVFEGEKIDYSTIFQTFEGNSLFSSTRHVFVENFISKTKSNSNEFKQIVQYLNSNKDLEIVFWEEKELTKTQLNVFKNPSVTVFNYPLLLFTFLDSIKPASVFSIKLFHDLLQTMETELIFYMLVRQLRLLLAVTDTTSQTIDEVKRLAPWQLSKLKKQAQYFGKEKLLKAYKKLYKIDYETKFGLSSFNLSSSIDFFLIDL